MRILVGTHFFDSHRGGVEIVAGQLARGFLQRGVEVVWLAADASPPPGPELGTAIPLRASNVIERRWGLPLPLPGTAAISEIWRAVGDADAILLHDGLYPTNVAIFIASRLRAKPVMVIQHIGRVPYRSLALRTMMALANAMIVRPMLAMADQVVFISDITAAYFAQVRFQRAPRTICNGVDPSIFRPRERGVAVADQKQRLGLPREQPLVLFVGRFVEKKGLPVLERLALAMPHVTFAFAGWGQLDPAGWNLPNVHVRRSLGGEELAELYRAGDLFVLPSSGEGLPLVLQEALACGLSVICGADTARADAVLESLVTAIPVDPYDTAATALRFQAAIEARLMQVETEAAIEERARTCVARYAWLTAATAHLDLLEAVLRDRVRTKTAQIRAVRSR